MKRLNDPPKSVFMLMEIILGFSMFLHYSETFLNSLKIYGTYCVYQKFGKEMDGTKKEMRKIWDSFIKT